MTYNEGVTGVREGEGGLVSTSCDGVHGMHRVNGEQGETDREKGAESSGEKSLNSLLLVGDSKFITA